MFLCNIFCNPIFADEIEDIIPAIIKVESGGNPHAVSKAGAIGLMQITPIVLKEYNQHYTYFLTYTMEDMKYPFANKVVGYWYLRRLKDHYLKDNYTIERMLAAYNGGITRLKKCNYDISKMPVETRQYVKKVMRLYKKGE